MNPHGLTDSELLPEGELRDMYGSLLDAQAEDLSGVLSRLEQRKRQAISANPDFSDSEVQEIETRLLRLQKQV